MTPEQNSTESLPAILPVFPLNALLFPRWQLPLVIFEPRYLNMLDDVMSSHHMIGMIQALGGDRSAPSLAKIGCLGRVDKFIESEDGRYHIVLTGLSRYKVAEEQNVQTPYRQVKADYSMFSADLKEPDGDDLPDRLRIEAACDIYANHTIGPALPHIRAFDDSPYEVMINALIVSCPFRPIEKQALLEAATLKARSEMLIKLLAMAGGNN